MGTDWRRIELDAGMLALAREAGISDDDMRRVVAQKTDEVMARLVEAAEAARPAMERDPDGVLARMWATVRDGGPFDPAAAFAAGADESVEAPADLRRIAAWANRQFGVRPASRRRRWRWRWRPGSYRSSS